MFSVHRKIFAGIGLDLLAAAALTGIGFVFHMIVNQGSALALFDVLLLGIAVIAILTAYNWLFNEAGGQVRDRKKPVANFHATKEHCRPFHRSKSTDVNDE